MADVKLVKSIYTASVVTSLGELTSSDNAAIPGSLSVGSLAGFLFGTAGAITALTAANRFKISSFSRDISLTGSDQAISGVGFTPGSVILLANINDTPSVSIGYMSSAGSQFCIFDEHASSANNWNNNGAAVVVMQTGVGAQGVAVFKSMDADGFTVTWSKVGSPTGIAVVGYLALR